MNNEEQIMELLVKSGDGRSLALEAVSAAKEKNFALADEKMEKCEDVLIEAHEIQTNLITSEVNGEKVDISMLVIHSQDHLMNAMTVKELANQMIELYRVIYCC